MSGSSGHGLKQTRIFAMEWRKGDDGRSAKHAVIICVICDVRDYHHRHGKLDSWEFFEKAGWQVGNNISGDKCPNCKGKVVHMTEHKKSARNGATEPEPAPVAEGQGVAAAGSRALVAVKIVENFDDANNHYKAGWSDVAVAKSMNAPIEVVRAEREHYFPGSVGEDPGINEFLAGLRGIDVRLPDIDHATEALTSSAAKIEARQKENDEAIRALRLGINKFAQDRDWFRSELKRMQEIAEKIKGPFEVRKAG